jgi:catechol 2,3-dioxygenase-like lactoylglutathione lyase family enzyme
MLRLPGVSKTRVSAMIGRLSVFALDCPDPVALAAFYSAVTGFPVAPDEDGDTNPEWVELVAEGTGASMAFQRVDEYAAPVWPGNVHPQQAHVDVDVMNLDDGEREVLALGATKAEFQPGTTFRVFIDPAGHPFCLVLDPSMR